MILSLYTVSVRAQNNTPVKEGVIVLYFDDMSGFTDLQFVGDNVIYTNIIDNKRLVKPLTDVQRIDNESQKTVYRGPVKPRPAAPTPTPVVYNDTLFRPGYPEGVYFTKENFLAKRVTPMEVNPRGLVGIEKPVLTTIEHACFFYYYSEKLTDAFAVSYKGNLYFSLKAILGNRNKTDRAQTSIFENAFVRVILGGEHYLYTEADLANAWAQGFAYGAVGGVAGSALAKSWTYGKGIVWDVKNAEFNIFKNCNDYNVFMKAAYPDGVQVCKDNQPDLYKVRLAVDKIK